MFLLYLVGRELYTDVFSFFSSENSAGLVAVRQEAFRLTCSCFQSSPEACPECADLGLDSEEKHLDLQERQLNVGLGDERDVEEQPDETFEKLHEVFSCWRNVVTSCNERGRLPYPVDDQSL